jgi:hypothetical protein
LMLCASALISYKAFSSLDTTPTEMKRSLF